MSDNRASVYEEDGKWVPKWVYRASAVGGCSRALWAARMGLEGASTPEWLQEKYDQGNAGEEVIVEKLAALGIEVGDRQAEVELVVDRNSQRDVVIRGHIDGMLYKDTCPDPRMERLKNVARVLVEIKTMSVDVFEKYKVAPWTAHHTYPGQLKIYMTGMETDYALYVVGIKGEDGQVDAIELYALHVTQLDVDLNELFKKVRAVETGIENTEMPKCEVNMYPCPFFFLHDEEEEKAVIEIPHEDEGGINTLLLQYLEWDRIGKDADVKKKEIREQLAWAFDSRDARGQRIKTSMFEVMDVVRLGARRLDMKKVEEAGIDLSRCYSVGKESRWPKIKPLELQTRSGSSADEK